VVWLENHRKGSDLTARNRLCNTKVNLRRHWIIQNGMSKLIQFRNNWEAVLFIVMNLLAPKNAGNSSTS
jgi:hypothetical protein